MRVLQFLSEYTIPLVVFYVVGYGLLQKINVYESFVAGAEQGVKTVARILPTMIGLMVGVGLIRTSGFLDFLGGGLGNFAERFGISGELIPLILVRMFSSSAATGLCVDIFEKFGPDSLLGKTASILMSCTETIFYTMSVYFMAAKVKKTGYTLPGALAATLAGIVASVLLAGRM